MYPAEGIPGYSREQFIDDLLARARDGDPPLPCRRARYKVQIDFTEGRLAMKIDPSGHLLHSFIDLNNLALSRFSPEERQRIGVHTCPGGDRDSTHSADVDYAELLPSLFQLKVGNFYIALAGERDRVARPRRSSAQHMKPDQRVFVGVVAPIDPRIETAGGGARPGARSGAVHSRSSNWARPTIAAFRRSATTRRRPATRRSRRFARASLGTALAAEALGADKWRSWTTRNAAAVGRAAERQQHPARAPARRRRAAADEGGASRESGAADGGLDGRGHRHVSLEHPVEHRRVGRQSRPALRTRDRHRTTPVARRVHRRRAPRRSACRDRSAASGALATDPTSTWSSVSSGPTAASIGLPTRRRPFSTTTAGRST